METTSQTIINTFHFFRSEDEFEKFQQMDIERRRQEASLGSERKPRLIEESELPPFLIQVKKIVITPVLGPSAETRAPKKSFTLFLKMT